MTTTDQERITILLVAERDDRASLLRERLTMLFPRASLLEADGSAMAEGQLPEADAAVIDGDTVPRATADLLCVLRARGFGGPIIVISPVPDDSALRGAAAPLGARCVARAAPESAPDELGTVLVEALDADSSIVAELRRARRVFAAGQVALSLQHGINNPLAALLAEAQLLQFEELNGEQRASVDRMVELCRRIVVLVRRLDALAEG
jgi:signal transduction histidine kinase